MSYYVCLVCEVKELRGNTRRRLSGRQTEKMMVKRRRCVRRRRSDVASRWVTRCWGDYRVIWAAGLTFVPKCHFLKWTHMLLLGRWMFRLILLSFSVRLLQPQLQETSSGLKKKQNNKNLVLWKKQSWLHCGCEITRTAQHLKDGAESLAPERAITTEHVVQYTFYSFFMSSVWLDKISANRFNGRPQTAHWL